MDSDSESGSVHSWDCESGSVHSWDWRSESMQRFSDWEICVNGTTSYHVHRIILSEGPYASGYFQSLFRSSMNECNHNKTELANLSDQQAELIPVLLDVVYNGDLEDGAIEIDHALDLFELATYFDVPTLQGAVERFVEQDTTPHDTIEHFLTRSENRPGFEEFFLAAICNLSNIYSKIPQQLFKTIKPSWLLKALTIHDSLVGQNANANAIISYSLLSHCSNIDKDEAESLLGFVEDPISPSVALRLLCALDAIDDIESFDEDALYKQFLQNCFHDYFSDGWEWPVAQVQASDSVEGDWQTEWEDDSEEEETLGESHNYQVDASYRDRFLDVVLENWKVVCEGTDPELNELMDEFGDAPWLKKLKAAREQRKEVDFQARQTLRTNCSVS